MNNKLDYRFKAYQIETDKGYQWGIDYPDFMGVCGAGNTIEEAINDGKENLRIHIQMLKEAGENIPNPTLELETNDYSGKMVLRLSKSNHKKLSEVAENEGVSINSLLNEMVTEGLANRLNQKATKEIIDDLRNEMITDNNLSLNLKHN